MINLVSKDKRQIVDYDIAFDKSRERIQQLVDNSPKDSHYYSDSYSSYNEICYYGTHTSLKNKSQTYTVEGVNSDIRKYIAALQRQSKYFFRSLDTFKSVMNIFIRAYNKFGTFKFRFPNLKNSAFFINFIPCL